MYLKVPYGTTFVPSIIYLCDHSVVAMAGEEIVENRVWPYADGTMEHSTRVTCTVTV